MIWLYYKQLNKKSGKNLNNTHFNDVHSITLDKLPIEIQEKLITRERHLKELYDTLGITKEVYSDRTCIVCDGPLREDQKLYCSAKCRSEGLKAHKARHIPGTLYIVRFCEICGKPFLTTKVDLGMYTGRTCGKKRCKDALMTEKIMNTTRQYQCIFCDTRFYSSMPALFCSDSCRYAYAYFCTSIFDKELMKKCQDHEIRWTDNILNDEEPHAELVKKRKVHEVVEENKTIRGDNIYYDDKTDVHNCEVVMYDGRTVIIQSILGHRDLMVSSIRLDSCDVNVVRPIVIAGGVIKDVALRNEIEDSWNNQ